MAVYVYDLPVDLGLIQFAHRVWARNLRNGEMIYAAEWRFLELLLSDSAVRAVRPRVPQRCDEGRFQRQRVAGLRVAP